MKEDIDGYRRTSIKTKDKSKALNKVAEFKERGDDAKILESCGYYYVYVKKERPL